MAHATRRLPTSGLHSTQLHRTITLAAPSITELLIRWKDGDRGVEDALASGIYPVLRQLARSQLARHRGAGAPSLSATELANEAYLKLCGQQGVDWQNRNHFYAIAATVMRRVVIDYLRQRTADKRGGAGKLFVAIHDVNDSELPQQGDHVDWLAVEQALNELQTADPACARVVEMRLFSGLTTEQIAEVCGSSTATVGRQWRFARSWIADRLELQPGDPATPPRPGN